MFKTTATITVVFVALVAGAFSSQAEMSISSKLASMPLAFTANQGQWDEKVRFRADAGGATMWFTADGAYYQFIRRIDDNDSAIATEGAPPRPSGVGSDRFDRQLQQFETMMIKASFVGANPHPRMHGEGELDYKCNYFIGNDPAAWRSDVANYSAVLYEEVYPGIDIKYYGNGKEMEYDFIVSPGADLSRIQVNFKGIELLRVNDDGELVVTSQWGDIIERRPVLYQVAEGERVSVEGGYELAGDNSFTFYVGDEYDPNLPLIIDPVLEYGTYLGGTLSDVGQDIAVDNLGQAYVVGHTASTDFPTENPYQSYQGGAYPDVFVTKLTASGDGLAYSTYLGGSDADHGYGIAIDGSGCAYVTGKTASSDFPTANPLQGNQGDVDGFVTKLNSSGNGLVYSTYLGGSDADGGNDIALDESRHAYVTGYTESSDFPTANPFQLDQGGMDAFVVILSSTGSVLYYGTYLGGAASDRGCVIDVDRDGFVYLSGDTYSPDFPVINPYQTYRAGWDIFVSKMGPFGSGLIYSTFLGGSGGDNVQDMVVDEWGHAYLTGITWSPDYPVEDPYQTAQGLWDAFVTKLNSTGDGLTYSTYLGGTDMDGGYGISVDDAGFAWVTGWTQSSDFPTVNPYQTDQGQGDVFVTKIRAQGNGLDYSTYLGGSAEDEGHGIAMDVSGGIYIVGATISSDFPTYDPYQDYQGLWDAFVVKLTELCCSLRGDINHDGTLDPLDPVYLVNYLWLGGPPPPCMDEADVNGSGGVDPLDAIYLVNYFWNGGPAPVPCP